MIKNIDPVFYAYMVANLILWGLGAAYQFRQRKSGDKKDPYH
jgi:hypothetical protein